MVFAGMSIGRTVMWKSKTVFKILYRNDSVLSLGSSYGTCGSGYQAGGVVKLITQSLRVSGHGNARDLQLMINLLQPKYLPNSRGIPRSWMPMLRLLWQLG